MSTKRIIRYEIDSTGSGLRLHRETEGREEITKTEYKKKKSGEERKKKH